MIAALESCEPSRIEKSEEIVTAYWNDFSISLVLNSESHVSIEAQEMAQIHQFAPPWDKVSNCQQRIELSSSLDSNMDHFNDYIFVLEALEAQLGEVVILDLHSGELI